MVCKLFSTQQEQSWVKHSEDNKTASQSKSDLVWKHYLFEWKLNINLDTCALKTEKVLAMAGDKEWRDQTSKV